MPGGTGLGFWKSPNIDEIGGGPNGGGPLFFTNPGSCGPGDSLYVGNISTDKTGIPFKGSNKLVGMTITTGKNVSVTKARVQLKRRTAVSTWSLISGAIIEITVGNYRNETDYDIILPDDPELGAELTSDSGDIEDVNLTVQLKYIGPSA